MINGLDLFSGTGGLSVALRKWVKTVAYCENDRYCQGVLLSRMQVDDIDRGPIWDDVRTLGKSHFFDNDIDIIFGGFPCQDISVAGHGRGLDGERSGLYFEIERLLKETKARWLFLENVPAIRTKGLRRIIWGLTNLGYDCRWTRVSAKEVGAHHIRERWFLLAHARGKRRQQISKGPYGDEKKNEGRAKKKMHKLKCNGQRCGNENVADPECVGLEGRVDKIKGKRETKMRRRPTDSNFKKTFWSTEPNVGRVVNGLPFRVDRIKALGNAVVPLQAETAFKRLMGGIQ